MPKLIFITILLCFSLSNCTNSDKVRKLSSISLNAIDWKAELEAADSFEKEINLLDKLILVDTLDAYQQLIANRLQTFDLRHLKDDEKFKVIQLYESSILNNKNPSESVLYTAQAKLSGVLPSDNEQIELLVNKILNKILSIIK